MSIGNDGNLEVGIAPFGAPILSTAQLVSDHHLGNLVRPELGAPEHYRLEGSATERDLALALIANNEVVLKDTRADDLLAVLGNYLRVERRRKEAI